MSKLIYEKNVDQSFLTRGFTIPMEKWADFESALGISLKKGEKKEVVVWLRNTRYSAWYRNVGFSKDYAQRIVFQINYSGKLLEDLRSIFLLTSEDVTKVVGKVEIYSDQIGEIEFKCFPGVKNTSSGHPLNETVAEHKEYTGGLFEAFSKILGEYTKAKKEKFAEHHMGSFFRTQIPKIIYDTNIVPKDFYLISGSVGQGTWATIPWICIFDKKITKSATKGVYIVYLLSQDGNSLFLTFNQGCTEIRKNHSKKETIRLMHENTERIRGILDNRGFHADSQALLGNKLTELGELYQEGIIFYKEYKRNSLPQEDELRLDLENIMGIYKEYAGRIYQAENHQEADSLESEVAMSSKEIIENVKAYIASKGFTFDDGLIENYYLSLKSKPFVILAGTSGTGKTRLVRLFAEAIGANNQNGRYKLVAVRPDWSDSSDLFGHVNLNDKFIPGVIIDFVIQAKNNPDKPYFLCLDEMNLARVEYYLSDILSILETREYKDGVITTDALINEIFYGDDEQARKRYGIVSIPENLYIVGTVNMDETTFPFSKKVLDRANTIEFSTVDLLANFENSRTEIVVIDVDNSFMKADYIFFNQCSDEMEFAEEICMELQEINKILEKSSSHVGYRVRDEIVFYMINNKKAELLDRDHAFDNQILQKILPRIQGSSSSVKKMLCELFKHCMSDFEGYQTGTDDISSKMLRAIEKAQTEFYEGTNQNGNRQFKYLESAKKIAYMVRRFEEDGFTAYWL